MDLHLTITPRQRQFIDADADEVLYGGAAGGGKSYGQVVDSLIFGLKYPGSKQLILRRTLGELEKSILRIASDIIPPSVGKYSRTEHVLRLCNGSLVDVCYCAREDDVLQYQSAEYDVIRFDELTHFTAFQYTYMLSRIRGANGFPKRMKCSTNPGGVGHDFVKERFIDSGVLPGEVFSVKGRTRLYIPATVRDNFFLMKSDPGYLERLNELPDRERRALLDGDWDIFEGQFFPEFSRDIHVCEPFDIPPEWRRTVSLDYGLDMLAVLWIASDSTGRAYVYREFCSGRDNAADGGRPLIAGEAADEILRLSGDEEISAFLAPPDIWNRQKDSGLGIADIFAEHGVPVVKAGAQRVAGWQAVKEWLRPIEDEMGNRTSRLKIFSQCRYLIRSLPLLQHSEANYNDVSVTPHPITHAPDALRYFLADRGSSSPDVAAEPDRSEQFIYADY